MPHLRGILQKGLPHSDVVVTVPQLWRCSGLPPKWAQDQKGWISNEGRRLRKADGSVLASFVAGDSELIPSSVFRTSR